MGGRIGCNGECNHVLLAFASWTSYCDFMRFVTSRVLTRLSGTDTISDSSFYIFFCSLERDAKLGALEERADALQDGCAQFEKQAAAMKNKFWLENLKSMIAIGVVGVIVLGLVYWKFFMEPAPPAYPYPPPPPPQAPAPAAPAGDSGGGDAGGDAGGDGGGE